MEQNVFNYLSTISHSIGIEHPISSYGDNRLPEPYSIVNKLSRTIAVIPDFAKTGTNSCPFCGTLLIVESQKVSKCGSYRGPGHGISYKGNKSGKKCTKCNWWYVVKEIEVDNDDAGYVRDDRTTYEGIICHFQSDLWSNSLELVEKELSEYREKLSTLSPKEVEVLIGEILCQYYKCEVRHVGRANDKGIDLIVVNSDSPIAVQVKHRSLNRKRKSESIIPVREFVGAMVGNNFNKGIFFTTDEKFSLPAKKYAKDVNINFAPIYLYTVREIKEFINNIIVNQWDEYDRVFE